MKLNEMVITNIHNLITVSSSKGRYFEMTNRPYYGLSLCISGQITYTQNGFTYVSNPRNAVILPKGQSYSLTGDKEGLFPVINFDYTGFDCKDIVIFPLQNPELLLRDFQKLTELSLFPNNRLQMYSIFYSMLQRIEQEQFPKNDVLTLALQYIEHNISDPELSNFRIAQNVNISEVYFRKLFSAQYHISPKQYIMDIRMQKAKHLLTDSPYTISAIGEECGFSSLYAFSRCFKEKVGISPSEYARQNRSFEI